MNVFVPLNKLLPGFNVLDRTLPLKVTLSVTLILSSPSQARIPNFDPESFATNKSDISISIELTPEPEIPLKPS